MSEVTKTVLLGSLFGILASVFAISSVVCTTNFWWATTLLVSLAFIMQSAGQVWELHKIAISMGTEE